MTAAPVATATPAPPARQRILDAASTLFYAHGIQSVGVDRVISEAGVAKATLYAYFRSKDDLVTAYLDQRSRAWREHVLRMLPDLAGTGRGRVLAVFDLLGEWFTAPDYSGCPFINAVGGGPLPPAAVAVTDRHREWVRTLFADQLCADTGRAEEATRVADQLLLLYDGAMVAARLDHTPTPAVTAREAARALLA